MNQRTQRVCFHCKEVFNPNWRNRKRQLFCLKPECRKTAKVWSHQAWLVKNPKYFQKEKHATRVRQWRARNPGYSRRLLQNCAPAPARLLQETLQDSITRNPLIIGIVARLCGCKSQESVAKVLALLILSGEKLQAKSPDR